METIKHYMVVSRALGCFTIHKINAMSESIYNLEDAKKLMLKVKEANSSSEVFLMQSIAEAKSKTEFFIKDL